jgi:hypothetical protein
LLFPSLISTRKPEFLDLLEEDRDVDLLPLLEEEEEEEEGGASSSLSSDS